MAKYVLLTGFEAFGGERINPSELVVRYLDGRTVAGRTIRARVFPVHAERVAANLDDAIAEADPDLVVCMGQAIGRPAIALERAAVNKLDFSQPANVGSIPKDLPVVPGGAQSLPSTLPLDAILSAWTAHDVPAYISESAGTYVCNQVFYQLQARGAGSESAMVSGFVHLPCLPVQAISAGADRTPSMPLEMMIRAIEILVATTVPWMERRRAMAV